MRSISPCSQSSASWYSISAALRLPVPWSTIACQALGREKEDSGIVGAKVKGAAAEVWSEEDLAYESVGRDMEARGGEEE